MGELVDFARRLATLTDEATIKRVVTKAGAAGKKAALDAAAKDLGGDRKMSGMQGRGKVLNAGYDDVGAGRVAINFRPPGLWKLAESGRQRTKPILPRRGRRASSFGAAGFATGQRAGAVLTPQGYRARSTSKPSRGLDTYSEAVDDARREVPIAANRQVEAELRRVVT